ncbi:MAG TPA: YqjK family protein [Steroidobacteraceae bacterium]
MSIRTVDLASREAALRLRCAVQRSEMARQVSGIEARLQSVDRVAMTARGFLLRPTVIAGGAVLLILLGRTRTFRVLGRGLVLLSAARRLARIMRL